MALVIIPGNPFPCICQPGKSRLTSGHENVIQTIRTSSKLFKFEHFGFLCRNNNRSWKLSIEKETLAYRAPLKFCFGFIHYAFGFVYNVRERLGLFSSFKDVLMIKSPLCSKSSLNFAQFDGKFIGICKTLPSVLRLRTLRFSH